MSDPTALPADRLPRTAAAADYCTNCDTLLGTPGSHILTVAEATDHLDITVETTARAVGIWCPYRRQRVDHTHEFVDQL